MQYTVSMKFKGSIIFHKPRGNQQVPSQAHLDTLYIVSQQNAEPLRCLALKLGVVKMYSGDFPYPPTFVVYGHGE